jgi:uncharacterized RDD family membrane protein YckC
VPLLGFIAWTLIGVFGLGAAVLAFASGLKKERPVRTIKAPVSMPPASPDAPSSSAPPAWADPSGSLDLPGPIAHASQRSTIASPAPEWQGFAEASTSDLPPIGAAASASAAAAPSMGAAFGPGAAVPVGSAASLATDLSTFPRATFLDRLAAFALDATLVLFAYSALRPARDPHDDGRIVLILLIYFVAFWAWKGTTLGGIICNLRVVKVSGQPLQFVDALLRGLGSVFSFLALGIGCLWILRDPERQAWHDKIANTYVVVVPKGWAV